MQSCDLSVSFSPARTKMPPDVSSLEPLESPGEEHIPTAQTETDKQHPSVDLALQCTATLSLAPPTFSWHAPEREGTGRCPRCSRDHRACWRHMTGIWLLSVSPLPGQAGEAAGTWRQQLVKLARGGVLHSFTCIVASRRAILLFFLAGKPPRPCFCCSFRLSLLPRTANEPGI